MRTTIYGAIGYSRRSYGEHKLNQAQDAAVKAMITGQQATNVGKFHTFTAQPSGVVTAHDIYLGGGNEPEHQAAKRETAEREHHDAVDRGHVYYKLNIPERSHSFRPLVYAAIHEARKPDREKDDAPFLMLADHLDELGFSGHAKDIRRRLLTKDTNGGRAYRKYTADEILEHLSSQPKPYWNKD